MTLSRNDYLNQDGQRVLITCLNWIPGLVEAQIKTLPEDPSELRLGDLFGDPESTDWDKRERHQRRYAWREVLMMLYPQWEDYDTGFEGLGSLFGSENNE